MNKPLRSYNIVFTCIKMYTAVYAECAITGFLLQYLQTSISGAGSDGNFDSYLQDVPKVGSDILNMVILGSFAASSAIVLTIYMYIKLQVIKVTNSCTR